MTKFCYTAKELPTIPKKQLGGKAQGLVLLEKLGLPVPQFVVIPPAKIEILVKQDAYDEVANEINLYFKNTTFAVRSNALIEDRNESSFAGQFMTKVNVSDSEILEALKEVIAHAKKFLAGNLNLFSVIIQEYIDPDISGVLFTRSPEGGRQFVLEYHEGMGEALVSGDVIPTQVASYWGEKTGSRLPGWDMMQSKLLSIEHEAGHPQDIEWCIAQGKWFILQARPITTIAPLAYHQILSLESELPEDEEYRYMKNDITDIIGTPYPLSYSLLQLIYSDTGPVAHAYREQGVSYTDTQFLKLLGRSIYIDAAKELASLLPSFQVDIKTGKQKFRLQAGLKRTLGNIFRLAVVHKKPAEIVQEFFKHISQTLEITSLDEWKQAFTEAYQSIFYANLIAATSLGQAKVLLNNQPINILDVLEGTTPIDEEYEQLRNALPRFVGNGLDITDTSKFVAPPLSKDTNTVTVTEWLDSLSVGKRNYIEKKCILAREGERLREMGRWITALYISKLRDVIKEKVKLKKLGHDEYLFLTLDELMEGKINVGILKERKRIFDTLPEYTDTIIASSYSEHDKEDVGGVSAGIGQGVLLDFSQSRKLPEGGVIILAETLSPSLTPYLDKIQGICALRGGMLSHLAIIARERGIPVIIQPEIDRTMIGQVVKIDGKTGEIVKV